MFFNSYSLFIYIAFFVLIYNAVRFLSNNRLLRNVVILGGNLLILISLVKEHSLIILAILSLLVFLTGRLLQKRNIKSILYFSLFLIILSFSIRNYEILQTILIQAKLSFITTPILSVQKIGLSYILFRFIHWIVESYKKSINNSDFLTFLNYIFFFPTFLAGPIDKYNNFHYWIVSKRKSYQMSLFFAGITRIFIGAFKTLGIVPFIISYATDYTLLLTDFTPILAVFISLTLYSFYIYLDFSGYSDIAIGTAYLIGIKTPENFNSPYLALDIADFWKRWHITFSHFLSLYVFKPIIRLLNSIINPQYRMTVSVIGYLLAFTICGLWHGIGLAIYKIWDVKIKAPKSSSPSVFSKGISGVITFLFVTIGWLFFHYTTEQLSEIFELIL